MRIRIMEQPNPRLPGGSHQRQNLHELTNSLLLCIMRHENLAPLSYSAFLVMQMISKIHSGSNLQKQIADLKS